MISPRSTVTCWHRVGGQVLLAIAANSSSANSSNQPPNGRSAGAGDVRGQAQTAEAGRVTGAADAEDALALVAGEPRRLRLRVVAFVFSRPSHSAVGAGVLSPWLGHFFLAKRSDDGMRSVR